MVALSLVTAGFGITAATWAATVFRARRAERRHPPEGEFVEVAGRRVHAVIRGEGPDVVLIHGAFGSARDFTFDLARRLEARYRVIVLDRPGHGYTSHVRPAYARAFAGKVEGPGEQADLLAAAARKLGAQKPIVVGHSYGGAVALAWALDHDPAAIVLLAGVAMPWPGKLGRMYRLNGTRLGGGLAAPLISGWTPTPILRRAFASTFAPQPAPLGYVAHTGPVMPVRLTSLRATARQVNTLRPHVVRMERRYARLRLPVEILHGAADTTVPAEVHALPLSKTIDNARLRLLDGVGHMPHHSDPEATVAAIDRAASRAGLI